MADEGRSVRDPGLERILLQATLTPYEVYHMPSGKAGVWDSTTTKASGDYAEFTTHGTFNLIKTSGFVALAGGRAYWDVSASAVSYKKVGDKDFYLGRFAEDASSGNTLCAVDLNADPPYDLDLIRDPFVTAIVGTQALGGLALNRRGGALDVVISSTNEAQKVDALSRDTFANAANWITEFAFTVDSDGAGTVVDVSMGLASATHTTDADSIAQHILCHLDANNTNINFQSKDGTTTVASTDSTTDYTEGSTIATRKEVWLDGRDPSSVKVYVDGVRVLTGTTFDVSAAASEWRQLLHVEKSAAADAYEINLEWMRTRLGEI